MVGAISAILPNIAQSGSAFSTPTANTSGGFGPDFLLGALGASRIGAAAAYDALGQPLELPANSPTAKARAANLNVAQLSIKVGDYTAARAAAERILDRDRNDETANYYIARIDMHEGKYDEAEQILLRLTTGSEDEQFRNDLRAVRALKSGDSAVLGEVRKLLKQSATARGGLQLADDFLTNGPKNLDVRLEIAAYYEKIGDLKLAGAELADATRTVPADAQGPLIEHLEKFAERHAGDRGSYDLLAQGYAAVGRLDDAARAFDRALELAGDDYLFKSQVKSDFADVYSRRGHELQEAGREDEALDMYHRALGVVSDDKRRTDISDLQYNRGLRLQRQGMGQFALKAYNEARIYLPIADHKERADNLIKQYELLAARFEASDDLKNAVTARAGAYNLDTKNTVRKRSLADAHNDYGLQLMDQQKYYDALKQFKAATKLFGDDADYAANLAAAQSHI